MYRLSLQLIAVGLLLVATASAADHYKKIRPTRLNVFIGKESDVVVLYCKHSMHCDFVKGLLNLYGEKPELLECDGEVKLGYFQMSEDYKDLVGYWGSSGEELAFYQYGKIHNKIPIQYITSPETFKSFVKRSSQDLLPEVASMNEFEEQILSCNNEFSTVVYFALEDNEALEKALLSLYLSYDDIFQFRAIRDADMIYSAGETAGTVKVYQCYDHDLTKSFSRVVDDDIEGLTNWILHRGTPLVVDYSPQTMDRAIALFGLCIFVAVPEAETEAVLDVITPVAKELKTAGFVWDSAERYKENFIIEGASGKVFPTAIAVTSRNGVPIIWDENKAFTVENLKQWVLDVNAGTAETFKKSAAIPAPSDSAVQTLVYDNYNEAFSDPRKTSVVLITGSYSVCSDCFATRSIFKRFAEANKRYPVQFYEYNIHENYPIRPVTKLPEIFLHKDGLIEHFPDQAPTLESIQKWLKPLLPTRHDEL